MKIYKKCLSIYFYFLIIVFLSSLSVNLLAQDSLHYDKKIVDVQLKTKTNKQPTTNKQSSAIVLIFLDTECPMCQKYVLKINQIDSICKANQIPFYGVFTAKNVRKSDINAFKTKYKLRLKSLIDKKLVLVKALKASTTPEVFLLDRVGEKVLYRGLIDDWFYMLGRHRKEATVHFLLDAMDAYLKNKPINTKKTTPIGCLIG
ncbi:MAG: hypothetical protein EAZ08_05680 [Cytophagales bacterium]|nr:MAG: hypothetical protein EAZ08_05680 [Cytophagales bacterium]